ncbi:Cytochrome P450 protein [Rutstroemia sp. NJR-2017a BBW]|nr:Cytochrome P450 protein [Rutstroemia sp. NJR-2017a BBW]
MIEIRSTDLFINAIQTTLIVLLTWFAGRSLYRLYLHPLAKFPGPKQAAITHWYEGYYDIIHKGRYIFHIEELHKKYGPIIRVGPNELHILDPDFYHTLYSTTNFHANKSPYFYSMLGNPLATFPCIDSAVHRKRRAALSPFFSAGAIAKFEPFIQSRIDALCARIAVCAERDESVPLFYAYRCLTVDIISEYVFGGEFGMLGREDWGEGFYAAWRALWELSGLIRQVPVLMRVFEGMPRWMTRCVNSKAGEVLDMQDKTDEATRRVLELKRDDMEGREWKSIIWEVARSRELEEEEKSFKRLAVEANSLLAAGFESTGAMLGVITLEVLRDEEVHAQLRRELEETIPDEGKILAWRELEKLPVLSAVVREALRISVGPFARLPRVFNQAIQYKEWTIPAGTEIGQSNLFIAHSPSIFPEPHKFIPSRWATPNSAERRRLEHHLHPFGRGSRQCVAMNLAYAELYRGIATLFRRFPHLRLDGMGEEDGK